MSNEEAKNSTPFGRYKVEAVIMKEGIDEHIFRRISEFPYKIKFEEKYYEVKTDALFSIEVSRLTFIRNLLFLIIGDYMIIFREGETEPLIRVTSEISPRVLKVARTSTAVQGMIKEWFSGGKFPINKWVFIFIVAAIGTFVYAKLSGMI